MKYLTLFTQLFAIGIVIYIVFVYRRQPKHMALRGFVDYCLEVMDLADNPISQTSNHETLYTAFAIDLRQFIQNCGDLTEEDRRDLQIAFNNLDSTIEQKDWPKAALVLEHEVFSILDSILERLMVRRRR